MEYCLAEPNINLFILGDIGKFGFDHEFQEVWIQTAEERITGVILRYHDNLLVYSKDLDMDFGEVKTLLDTLHIRIISGKGMVMDRLHLLTAEQYTKRDMIFCELIDPSKLAEDTGGVTIAEGSDAMEIAKLYGEINEFAGLYASEVEVRHSQIANRIKSGEGIHLFIKQDGKMISHANSAAETDVSGMIGGILTVSEYRNRGLAGKVISAVCKNLAHRGKSACLFHDNPKADGLFTRLGFRATNKWTILEKRMNQPGGSSS
jgi:predicted GNAT family acetyltransferase